MQMVNDQKNVRTKRCMDQLPGAPDGEYVAKPCLIVF